MIFRCLKNESAVHVLLFQAYPEEILATSSPQRKSRSLYLNIRVLKSSRGSNCRFQPNSKLGNKICHQQTRDAHVICTLERNVHRIFHPSNLLRCDVLWKACYSEEAYIQPRLMDMLEDFMEIFMHFLWNGMGLGCARLGRNKPPTLVCRASCDRLYTRS